MSQNAGFTSWSREKVDRELKEIMRRIHETCVRTAEDYGEPGNYVLGANIGGFVKVANAMLDQGLV
jgi:glutamate dehydrogenase (NADP+)